MNQSDLLEMKKCFEISPFTYATMSQIMAEVKKEFMPKISSPILLFYGKRGNGKTSIVKAGLKNSNNVAKFSDDFKSVKKLMKNIPGNQVALLDNYPQYISSLGKQEGKRKLEKFTDMASEDSDFPLLLITAEEYIFADFSDSIRTRMLEIEVPNVEEKQELMELRNFLQDNKEEYVELLEEFWKWKQTMIQDEQIKFEKFCNMKRKQYPDASQRTHGMIFLYDYTYDLLNQFMEDRYRISLSLEKKEENVRYLYKGKEEKNIGKPLIYELLKSILVKNALDIKEAYTVTRCDTYFSKGNCDEYDSNLLSYEECDKSWCRYYDNSRYYEPASLLLDKESLSAVLVGSAKRMYQYPQYIPSDNALLIVRANVLLSLINMELEIYSHCNQMTETYYGPKKMNKELFINNLCLYHYLERDHKIYSFDWKSGSEYPNGRIESLGNEKVIFLKLDTELYEIAYQQCRVCKNVQIENSVKLRFYSDLKKFGNHVQSFAWMKGK